MVILTTEQIQYLLKELSYETIVEKTDKFQYRIQREKFGYSDNTDVNVIQAALSIALQLQVEMDNRRAKKDEANKGEEE